MRRLLYKLLLISFFILCIDFKVSAQLGSFKPLVPLQGEDYLTGLYLLEDGSILNSIDQDGNHRIWDTKSLKLLGEQKAWKNSVFSPDGTMHTSRNEDGLIIIDNSLSTEVRSYLLDKQLSDRLLIQFFTSNNQLVIISYSGEVLKFTSDGQLVQELNIGKELLDCFYLEKESKQLMVLDVTQVIYKLDVDFLELDTLCKLRSPCEILHFHVNSTLDSLFVLCEGKVDVFNIGKDRLTLLKSYNIHSSINFIWSIAVNQTGEIIFSSDEFLMRLNMFSEVLDTIYQCSDFSVIDNIVIGKKSAVLYFSESQNITRINIETGTVSRFDLVSLADVQNNADSSLSEFFIEEVWPKEIENRFTSKKAHAFFLTHTQNKRRVYISEDPEVDWYWSRKPNKNEVDAYIKLPYGDEIMEVYKDESNEYYVLFGFQSAYAYKLSSKQLSVFKNSSLVLADNFYFIDENKVIVFKSLYDSILSFFDVETGNIIDSLRFESDIVSMDLSFDGSELAVLLDNGNLRIIDIENRSQKNELDYSKLDGAYSLVGDLTYVSSNEIVLKISDSQYRIVSAIKIKEFVELFYFGEDWIVKLLDTPFFMGTPKASKLLNYTNNKDSILSFEQLDLFYNRPDIVLDSIEKFFGYSKELDEKLALSKRVVRKRLDLFDLDMSKDIRIYANDLPVLKLKQAIPYNNISGEVSVNLGSNSSNLKKINAYVNEVPLFGQHGLSINSSQVISFDTTLSVQLNEGLNNVQFALTNNIGLQSFKYSNWVYYFPKNPIKENTYFIGIGVNEFSDQGHDLTYCVKDVQDLAKKFAESYSSDTILFRNTDVTRDNILGIREWLMNNTTIHDKVIISCSSHGLLDSLNQFYLATSDINFEKPWQRGITYSELEWLLDSIPARKKLLLIDACNSGENEKTQQIQEQINTVNDNAQLLAARGVLKKNVEENISTFQKMTEIFVNVRNNTGSNIIAAAGGNQSALEGVEVDGRTATNGAFTYSILEFLELNPGGVSVKELKNYVETRVEEITEGQQKPVSRQETFEFDWSIN